MCIPHPEKKYKRGEDAYFNTDTAIGIFDGVGSWVMENIDAGEYSKGLARYCEQYMHARPASTDAHALLARAVINTRLRGSSTALVALLDRSSNTLNICNVGDSILVVIRDRRVLFQTVEQQHSFNMPFQLQYDLRDDLIAAGLDSVKLRHNDIIIAASDGVWDNFSVADAVDLVNSYNLTASSSSGESDRRSERIQDEMVEKIRKSVFSMKVRKAHSSRNRVYPYEKLHQAVFNIANETCEVAFDINAISPFTEKAEKEGFYSPGGKPDDITVTVGIVRCSKNSYHSSFLADCCRPFIPLDLTISNEGEAEDPGQSRDVGEE